MKSIILSMLLVLIGCVQEIKPIEEDLETPPITENPIPEIPGDVKLSIFDIRLDTINKTTAQISWKSNIKVKAQVEYGIDGSYGSLSPIESLETVSHLHDLQNLKADTTYFYRIKTLYKDKFEYTDPLSFKTLKDDIGANPKTAKAMVLASAYLIGDKYRLIFSLPENALEPSGGVDTYINGVDQNDSANFSGYTREVSGLDIYQRQCFTVESRYTQLEPNQFLTSNELCVDAKEYPSPSIVSLEATNISASTARITVKSSLPSIYELYYSEDSSQSSSFTINSSYQTQTTYELKNLKADTKYSFKIRATTQQMKSSESMVQEFTTLKVSSKNPIAPTIKSVTKVGSDYTINFELSSNSLIPEGGFDTVINNNDQNDSANFSGYSRKISNLDIYMKQCFIIEARYTQLEPKEFLRSSEYCMDAEVKPTPVITGKLKAFPSAEGYGKNATGGRGGIVYHVTNLNESGPGSLRYGIENVQGKRTIVFDVSGYINIKTPLKVRDGNGNLTIAGQTAPAGGITVRGASLWILTGNVIVRHIRVRPGYNAYNPSGSNVSDPNYEPDDALKIQAFGGVTIENVILDHVSVSWGKDSLLDIGAPSNGSGVARNITVQNCMIAENIEKQYGTLINGAYNISWYRNITAYTTDRNIAVSSPEGQGLEMVNSFVFGTDRSTWYRAGNRVDYVGNVFVTGPRNRSYETFKMEASDRGADITKSLVYLHDNTDDGASADNNYNGRAAPYIQLTPYHKTDLPIIPNNQVEDELVGNVGNTVNQDGVDQRLFNQIKNRSGKIIYHENEVGGYPSITSVSRSSSYDTDNDGMSDEWERKTFGSLAKAANGDEDQNSYTNIEEFLHYLAN